MRDQTEASLLVDVYATLGLDVFSKENLASLTAALKANVKLDCDVCGVMSDWP